MKWGLESLVSLAIHDVQYVCPDPNIIQYWKVESSGKHVTQDDWVALHKSIYAGETRYQRRDVEKDLSRHLIVSIY
jgi:hypothetical protein